MAERATIARPYAKAAFEYARDANAFAQWSAGTRTAAEIVADPRVAAVTKSPQWTAADLAGLITDVAGAKLDAEARGISCACSRTIADSRCCRKSRRITRRLRAAAENTVDVDVVSATALDAAQQEKLSASLSTRLKRRVRMQNIRRPDAIGRLDRARRGFSDRRLLEGPSATARNRFDELELKLMCGPD